MIYRGGFLVVFFQNILIIVLCPKNSKSYPKKDQKLTLALLRPIKQEKIIELSFQGVLYFRVPFFRINIFKSLLKMSYIH